MLRGNMSPPYSGSRISQTRKQRIAFTGWGSPLKPSDVLVGKCFSETSLEFHRTTLCYVPEDINSS
jgi:hypothetical protein